MGTILGLSTAVICCIIAIISLARQAALERDLRIKAQNDADDMKLKALYVCTVVDDVLGDHKCFLTIGTRRSLESAYWSTCHGIDSIEASRWARQTRNVPTYET